MSVTTPVNTPERSGQFLENLPVEASTILFAGSLAAANAGGNLVPASDTANLKVLGRVEAGSLESVFDNSQGAAGDKTATVKRGVFVLSNSVANPVTKSLIGNPVYVEDAATVASEGSHSVVAGIFLGFADGDTTQVIVDTTRA